MRYPSGSGVEARVSSPSLFTPSRVTPNRGCVSADACGQTFCVEGSGAIGPRDLRCYWKLFGHLASLRPLRVSSRAQLRSRMASSSALGPSTAVRSPERAGISRCTWKGTHGNNGKDSCTLGPPLDELPHNTCYCAQFWRGDGTLDSPLPGLHGRFTHNVPFLSGERPKLAWECRSHARGGMHRRGRQLGFVDYGVYPLGGCVIRWGSIQHACRGARSRCGLCRCDSWGDVWQRYAYLCSAMSARADKCTGSVLRFCSLFWLSCSE
jgi:hypothetical protein